MIWQHFTHGLKQHWQAVSSDAQKVRGAVIIIINVVMFSSPCLTVPGNDRLFHPWKLRRHQQPHSTLRMCFQFCFLSILSSCEGKITLFRQTLSVSLTVSSSSRASVSPVVLLKLLVLDEEREMFGLPLLHSFSLMNGLLRKTEMQINWKWDKSRPLSEGQLHPVCHSGLTFLCWGRSQVSWDWMMSLTSLLGTVGRSLQAFGRCRQKKTHDTWLPGLLLLTVHDLDTEQEVQQLLKKWNQPACVFVRRGFCARVETREEAWTPFHWALQRRLGGQPRRLKITDYRIRFALF